ncbi:MAG: AEC family transporter [Eubacteriales bacterium]|nr:AEC family transporter [Eubacteriales bacterium]
MIYKSLETVFIMIIMIGVGWLMSYVGWLNIEGKRFIHLFIINISIPALTLTNFFQMFPKEMIGSTIHFVLIGILSMMVAFVLSELVAKLIRIEKTKSGSFVSMSSVSNSLFFGMPIVLSLFGDVSLPYILFYYIANSSVFWGICAPRIMKDGNVKRIRISENVRKIFNAPFVALILSILLLAIDLKPPDLVLTVSSYLGKPVTPLAAIFVGRIIYEIDFKNYQFENSILVILFLRFIASPAIMFLMTRLFQFDKLSTQVMVIMSAMPAMVQTSLVAEMYGADSKYVAFTISLTTVMGLFFIPFYMFVLNYL